MWNGMIQAASRENGHIMQGNKKLNEKKIHQTQKPVELYKWEFEKYAKKGDKILDTNMGSQSSRIAAFDLKELELEYYGCEIDKTHFDNGCRRFEEHKLKCEEITKFGYAKTIANNDYPILF
jgi:site-specific DNA-methyltransferase (adenine-specific)